MKDVLIIESIMNMLNGIKRANYPLPSSTQIIPAESTA